MVAKASTRVDAPDLLAELFPEGDVSRRVQRAFQFMRIAEEEIAKAKKEAPRKKGKIHAAFKHLYSAILLRHGDELYRAHVREILGRVKRDEPLEPGTDAECLVVLSNTSLRAPLASELADAMSYLFLRVFPDRKAEDYATGKEAWAGGREEILRDLRKKTASDRTVG